MPEGAVSLFKTVDVPADFERGIDGVLRRLQAQADATRATFEEFWKEDWFAGGFVWKWFLHYEDVGGSEDNRFTPQNKPAENVIRAHYSGLSQY